MTTVPLKFDFSGSIPETAPGQMSSVIVVTKSKYGQTCFAAYYLNRYPLEFEEPPEGAEESDDGGYLTSGWYYNNSNFEYEDCYYPIAGEILAWARMPKAVDVLTPPPQTHLKGLTDEQRGVGIGMAIAAAMLMRTWGNFTYATEILNTAGLETLEKLKASGVEQFDIDALMPILATEGKDNG